MTAALLTPAEAARLFEQKVGTIYVLAHRHRWRRLHIDGRVYYDAFEVATTLDRPA